MSFGKPDQNSIRPPPDSSEKGSGPCAKAAIARQTSTAKISTAPARVPVYPAADPVGPKDEQEGEEIEALDEEVQADVPLFADAISADAVRISGPLRYALPVQGVVQSLCEGRGLEFGHNLPEWDQGAASISCGLV